MITLITCTGDRPHLFRRLECWMARQSIRWTNWIVVDDGVDPTICTLGQRYIRLAPEREPTVSFANNLRAGLEAANHSGSEFVFFIEDDDWYSPNYLASLLIALTNHELAGESHSRYYNVAQLGYRHCLNADHASLCATAIRASLIPRIMSLIFDTDIYLDLRMWSVLDCSKHLQRTRHCVGLKSRTVGRDWDGATARFASNRIRSRSS